MATRVAACSTWRTVGAVHRQAAQRRAVPVPGGPGALGHTSAPAPVAVSTGSGAGLSPEGRARKGDPASLRAGREPPRAKPLTGPRSDRYSPRGAGAVPPARMERSTRCGADTTAAEASSVRERARASRAGHEATCPADRTGRDRPARTPAARRQTVAVGWARALSGVGPTLSRPALSRPADPPGVGRRPRSPCPTRSG